MVRKDSAAEADRESLPEDDRRERGVEPELDGLDENREEPIGGDTEFDRKLEAWLNEKNYENLPCTVTLYRVKSPNERVQICQWKNEIPDTHTIGLKFGGGSYILFINVPRGRKQKPSTNSRNFTLDPYYDTLKREAQQKALLEGQGGQAPAPRVIMAAPGPDQSLALVERLFALLTPILTSALTPRPQPNPGVEMIQTYQAMGQILREQTLDYARSMRENIDRNIDLQEEGDDMPDLAGQAVPEASVLQQILPFLGEIAKNLLAGGPGAAAAGAAVKAIPGFKAVMNNPAELKEILKYLDTQYGPDKTNIMLKKLKIFRPK